MTFVAMVFRVTLPKRPKNVAFQPLGESEDALVKIQIADMGPAPGLGGSYAPISGHWAQVSGQPRVSQKLPLTPILSSGGSGRRSVGRGEPAKRLLLPGVGHWQLQCPCGSKSTR